METLKPPKGAIRQRKRLGRGNGSGTGTTAGKGTKGQNSRSGGGVRPGFEGGQMPLYRRVARRGFSNSRFKKDYVVVSLGSIESRFSDGDTVSLATLRDHKLIGNRELLAKILGDGEISKKLTVVGVRVSRSAAAKIMAAGGTVDNIAGERIAEAAAPAKAAPEDVAAVAKERAVPKAAPGDSTVKTPPAKKEKTTAEEAPDRTKDLAAADAKDAEKGTVSAPKKSAPKKSAAKKADSGDVSETAPAEKDGK